QGAIWSADVSQAGAAVTARIAPGDSVGLGPTADNQAIRAGLSGALAMAHLAGSALSADAVQGAASVALNTLAQAGSDIGAVQGELGIDEARVEQASERLIAQGERMRESSSASVAVDAFEAASRFTELATQLEAAYTMTTRIHQLTLLRFLT
ncbi:MAG: flagellin, partial [Pseudomonadota bacterium]